MSTLLPAAAQAQTLSCTDDADAIGSAVLAQAPVVGATATVVLEPKVGRVASVTGITVSAAPGLDPVLAASPAPGTTSEVAFSLPQARKTIVAITWSQGEEPGVAGACTGFDRYVVTIGPSAKQLRAFVNASGRSQRTWVLRGRRTGAILDRLIAKIPDGVPDSVALPVIHAAARQSLVELEAVRPISRRYARQVRSIQAPLGLVAVNAALPASAIRGDRAIRNLVGAFTTADTLAEVTRANRAFRRQQTAANRFRNEWRAAVVAAFRTAKASPPRWVLRVGQP